MDVTLYSGGKEKPGGYSGGMVFEFDEPKIYISHCGTASVVSPYHKLYSINVYLCNQHLILNYIVYDDSKDYELIKSIMNYDFPKRTIAKQLVRMVQLRIAKSNKFNINTFAKEVYKLGIEEGKRLKIDEVKNVLSI